ncbi:PAS domain [Sesbania bispinosa]|nr:PAS domain [Sesbania bispinosa]
MDWKQPQEGERSKVMMEFESNHLCKIERSFDDRYSRHARESLDELPENFTITDPSVSGHPIVFASLGFLKMTGFTRDEVVGRRGGMFQGPGTCRRSVMEIREAVRQEREAQVVLLNYRKDGTPFWMLLRICPVFSAHGGAVVHFVAVQVPLHRNPELESEEPCEASDEEKRSAVIAMDNIFSVLTYYSESTGRQIVPHRTNPHLPDMPIVYASDAFLRLTGYARDEVLGRNCRFLGGADTDTSTLHLISESIKTEQPCTVRILNYRSILSFTFVRAAKAVNFIYSMFTESIYCNTSRKDKSSFWNLLHISPVRNASGKVAYFVGIQIEDDYKNEDRQCWGPDMRHLSVVGVVKVAVRSLSMTAGSSKS